MSQFSSFEYRAPTQCISLLSMLHSGAPCGLFFSVLSESCVLRVPTRGTPYGVFNKCRAQPLWLPDFQGSEKINSRQPLELMAINFLIAIKEYFGG